MRVIRDFRPHVLTTYDELGGYPHPDHVMTHVVSVSAFHAAGDPARYPHAGPAWQPLKMYYNQTIAHDRMLALHAALVEANLPSPYVEWIERRRGMPQRTVTTRVPCADHFEPAQRRFAGARHPDRPRRLVVRGAPGAGEARVAA